MPATIVVTSLQTTIHHGSEYERLSMKVLSFCESPKSSLGLPGILLLFIFDFPRDFITY